MIPLVDMRMTGLNIKRLRVKKGVSVREIQYACQLESPQAIYNWEKGKRIPSVDNLLILKEFFDCHIDDILVTQSFTA